MEVAKADIIKRLQAEVLSLQGFKKSGLETVCKFGLGPIEAAFPGNNFPESAIHEFISNTDAAAAATNGFIAAIAARLMKAKGVCIWVSTNRNVFPPALKFFGIAPERIIFIDLNSQKEVLWVIEEALKCDALAAVIGEFRELSFTQSRRLQLAVEQSRVTGFIHRFAPRSENTVACIARWKIRTIPGITEDNMPGVGIPRWDVQLVKVRNGIPGRWWVEWSNQGLKHIAKPDIAMPVILKLQKDKYA